MKSNIIGPPGRMVVCAACFFEELDIMLVGARHWDKTMRNQLDRTIYNKDDRCLQGFIDQHGKFMSRREAWTVACNSGQIIRRVGGDAVAGGTLYSENLY